MLSTPPAIISSASPALIARAAMPMASMPEPHRRLIVVPGHLDRQAGQQRRHARDVAVVLARLVGAAEDHVVDGRPVDVGLALHQRPDRDGAEIVGAHAGEAAAVAADRRADGVADEGFPHACSWPRPVAFADHLSSEAVGAAAEQRHALAVAAPDSDVVDAEPAAQRLLLRLRSTSPSPAAPGPDIQSRRRRRRWRGCGCCRRRRRPNSASAKMKPPWQMS